MTAGRLIGVVGPSGVGKDSIMQALVTSDPNLGLVRRTITRPKNLGGEDYDPVTPEVFSKMSRDGAFCLEWYAHDLRYGIPKKTLSDVRDGRHLLVNLSRGVLLKAQTLFDNFAVLVITASPETVANRLTTRGRESEGEIAKRLTRLNYPMPQVINAVTISNDDSLDAAVSAARTAIYPLSG